MMIRGKGALKDTEEEVRRCMNMLGFSKTRRTWPATWHEQYLKLLREHNEDVKELRKEVSYLKNELNRERSRLYGLMTVTHHGKRIKTLGPVAEAIARLKRELLDALTLEEEMSK